MSRIRIPAAVLSVLVLTTLAAAAQQTLPTGTIYCLITGGDGASRNCSYHTVEECNQARSGSGGTCVAYNAQR